MPADAQKGALDGLKVLDLSMYLPGPYASMLLADLGADVIHVEPPTGDLVRVIEPSVGGDSALHHWVGRNKRSCTVDLKSQEGHELFLGLVRDADVVIEGFTPGVAARLGVGYDDCRVVNPDVVYCSISGAGHGHDGSGSPGHDINYLARSGFLDQATDAAGSPVPIGPPIADVAAGLHAAVGILAALRHRDSGGGGQFIDVGLMGAALAMTGPQIVKALAPKPMPRDRDHNLGADPAYRTYRTKDGRHVVIGAFEGKFWIRLCTLLEREDLISLRHSEPDKAASELAGIFRTHDLQHWNSLLDDANVCYSPVNRIDEVSRDPLVLARQDFEISEGHAGLLTSMRNPIRLSATPTATRSGAPGLDEHGPTVEWMVRG